MWKWTVGILVVIAAGLGFAYFSADKDTRNLLANLPTDRNVLFWTIPQRDAAFRTLDWIPVLAKANVIESGDTIFPIFAPASTIRSLSDSAEKPPNTTECVAPIRAHASIATAVCGISGM